MDYSVVDELYKIYLDEFLDDAIDLFGKYYRKFKINNDKDLMEVLKQYVKEQTQKFSNAFISNKDEKNKVDFIVREATAAFETMVTPVQFLMDDYVYEGVDIEDIKFDGIKRDLLTPQDLFNMDINFIKEAIAKYDNCFEEAFTQVIKIIEYVKKTKLLQEIYKDNSWHDINFTELITMLYDKAKDKEIFNVDFPGIQVKEDALFDRIKQNCSRISTLNFDKYRPELASSKQMHAEFSKLIFCKNLLSYFETGIMPFSDGQMDWSISEYEYIQMVDEFEELYSKEFDETSFRNNQLNVICKPEFLTTEYKVDKARKVSLGDRVLIGVIIDASNSFTEKFNSIKYLIHINIEDVNNPCSNYEMQLNILPQGKIYKRLQLMRLDNWDSEQPHKNVARKLKTTTHIHLYNEFDLLRGKENGNYDIAYNLDSSSTDFETSLKTFLEILEFDANMSKKLYNSIVKTVNKCKSSEKTKEI